jgi:DNA-directed RNA polymerase subunit RPC12/RpoP
MDHLKRVIEFPLPVYYIFSTQESQRFLRLGVENQLTAKLYGRTPVKKIGTILELLQFIQKQFYPAGDIDSNPVNKGYWMVDLYRFFVCSKCKRIISNEFPQMRFYPNTKCPHCGGKVLYNSERWNQ